MNQNQNRGMKKWAPFSSLTEQASFLNSMMRQRKMESEQQLSEDQIEEIEYILNHCLDKKMRIYYFQDSLKTIEGIVSKIDTISNTLKIEQKVIPIQKIKKIILR